MCYTSAMVETLIAIGIVIILLGGMYFAWGWILE